MLPQILLDMGFEFGELAQMTDEWENRFDQLLEWMLWNREEVSALRWLRRDPVVSGWVKGWGAGTPFYHNMARSRSRRRTNNSR